LISGPFNVKDPDINPLNSQLAQQFLSSHALNGWESVHHGVVVEDGAMPPLQEIGWHELDESLNRVDGAIA
jgi:hypothetical protein